jgi:hypothetical protein
LPEEEEGEMRGKETDKGSLGSMSAVLMREVEVVLEWDLWLSQMEVDWRRRGVRVEEKERREEFMTSQRQR